MLKVFSGKELKASTSTLTLGVEVLRVKLGGSGVGGTEATRTTREAQNIVMSESDDKTAPMEPWDKLDGSRKDAGGISGVRGRTTATTSPSAYVLRFRSGFGLEFSR